MGTLLRSIFLRCRLGLRRRVGRGRAVRPHDQRECWSGPGWRA